MLKCTQKTTIFPEKRKRTTKNMFFLSLRDIFFTKVSNGRHTQRSAVRKLKCGRWNPCTNKLTFISYDLWRGKWKIRNEKRKRKTIDCTTIYAKNECNHSWKRKQKLLFCCNLFGTCRNCWFWVSANFLCWKMEKSSNLKEQDVSIQ